MTTISSLASAAALSGTEPLPVDQSGATVKATVNQVKTYVNTSPAITGGSINSTPIGATTPSTGAFTSLIASGAITNSPVLGSSYIYSIRSSQTTGQVGINLGGGTGGTDWLLYQPAYSNVLTWYGAAANRMTLDTSGNLAVTGNISSTARTLVGTTTDDGVNALQVNGTAKATSIKFANTGGTKQALDYYEEGTWTPTLGGTATYNTLTGSYTRVGRQVTAHFVVDVLAIGTGATMSVSGLPFACGSLNRGGGGVTYVASPAIACASITPVVIPTFQIINFITSSILGVWNNTSAVFGTGTIIAGTVTYFI